MAVEAVVLPAARQVSVLPRHNWFVGSDWLWEFTAVDDSGAIINITGYTIEVIIREYPDDPDALATFATGGTGVTITGATTGKYQVAGSDAYTDGRRPGRYVFTARRTDAGEEKVLNYGYCWLVKGPGA